LPIAIGTAGDWQRLLAASAKMQGMKDDTQQLIMRLAGLRRAASRSSSPRVSRSELATRYILFRQKLGSAKLRAIVLRSPDRF
jgi:hypothetical protein